LGDILNDITLPVSVEGWIYSDDPNYDSAFVINLDDYPTVYTGFSFVMGSTGLQLTYGDGTDNDHSGRRTKTIYVNTPISEWNHVVATIRGPTDMSMYLNGVDVGGTYSGSGG